MVFCSELPRSVKDVNARSRSLFDQRHEPFDGSGKVFDGSQEFFATIQYSLKQSQEFFDISQQFNHSDSNVFDTSGYLIDPGVSGAS